MFMLASSNAHPCLYMLALVIFRSLANKTFLGPVPQELKDLTVIEETMIARRCSKCWIIQLKEENQDLALGSTQRGVKGYIISNRQNWFKFYLPLSKKLFLLYVYCLSVLLQLRNGYVTMQNLELFQEVSYLIKYLRTQWPNSFNPTSL
jgi:hypothetical protein